VGGLKGAYGKYETDYYYHSVREAAEWLADYLKAQKITTSVKVGSNFSTHWHFRNQKNVSTSYFSYLERSKKDWDFAIVANSYIHPEKLKNKTWPPKNTIHAIYADGVPICAVIKRNTKADYEGIKKLEAGRVSDAIPLLEEALKVDCQNEFLWFKYGWALYKNNTADKAEFALNSGLKILPNDERILQLLGDLAIAKGDTLNATRYYESSIRANRKFVTSYVKLANIFMRTDIQKSRSLLLTCFRINPRYKTAVKALANSYRNSNPGIAKKYDELAKTLK
jgi:tetratricopeptide (TPR) repeat protein